MKDSIRDLIKKALPGADIPSELADLGDDAFALVKQYASRPCRNHMHHQRMIEKLERKEQRARAMGRKRPFAIRLRLAHHRLWRRHWEAKCEAENLCAQAKGC